MTVNHQYSPFSLQDQYRIRFGQRSFSFSTRAAVLTLVIVAVLLREASALYQGNTVTDLPGIFDQISYDGLARRVIDGYGFSFAEGHWPATRAGEPTAHWSYLYTLYLIVVYKLFGTSPLFARVTQALVVGFFQTIFIWRIGTYLFNRTVGLIAAILNSFYIYFFYYAGALVTESFYITGILWTFDCAFRLLGSVEDGWEKSWRQWVELGLAIGVTVLLRQVFLLFLPVLFLWLWWNSRYEERTWWKQYSHWSTLGGLLVVVIILAAMIIPWTIRNYRAFGTFVLLNTNSGFAFYWGNHPIYGTKFIPLLDQSYQDLIPTNLLVLNEGQLDQVLLREGIKIVLNDPGRYILLSLSRIEEYIKFWPSKDSGLLSNLSRVGSFGILLPFMLSGIWVSLPFFRRPVYPKQRSSLLIFYLFAVIYSVIHIMSWTLIRYRLPVDALLIVFSALSIEILVKRPNRILMMDC